jgi:hypothetical protein
MMMGIMTRKMETLQLMHVWAILKYGAPVTTMDFALAMVVVIFSTDKESTKVPT